MKSIQSLTKLLEKKCKHCSIIFVTKTNKQIFCSPACKRISNSNNQKNKIKSNCKTCNKEIFIYPSRLKTQKFCGIQCRFESQKIHKTERIKINCPKCNKIFFKTPKKYQVYCSLQCSKRELKTCVTCGNQFDSSHKNAKRCSRKCQFKDQSNGTIKIKLNGITGYRTDLNPNYYFKSAFEADFARFLSYVGISYVYESKTFELNDAFYTPDFYLDQLDLYIELKGTNRKKYADIMLKNLRHHEMLTKTGVKILTVFQDQFKKTLQENDLWLIIPILETRTYKNKQAKQTVIKHENKKNTNN